MIPTPLPSETAAYRHCRQELLEAEIALKDQREKVAALRRRLPLDCQVETDYRFSSVSSGQTGDRSDEVALSALFTNPTKPLVLIHFMYGGAQAAPCPMCNMWADGYNAVAPHLSQRVNLGLVAETPIEDLAALANKRGWRHLKLLSSAGTSFKRDYGMADTEANQFPGVSVFQRGEDGTARHFYTGGALMAEGHFRGMDLLTPVWNLLDLTPEGRGDWVPSLNYD